MALQQEECFLGRRRPNDRCLKRAIALVPSRCTAPQARYQELEVKKDGMKFVSKALKAQAQRLQALTAQYEERQGELLAQARPGLFFMLRPACRLCLSVWPASLCLARPSLRWPASHTGLPPPASSCLLLRW